jgi:hypothetical protein
MVLLLDECTGRLVTIASRGYGAEGPACAAAREGPEGIGAEVTIGHGAIGIAAEKRRMVRIAGMGAELRYGRAIRGRIAAVGESDKLRPEIPLPGLADAQAQLALPLLIGERLVGVLAVESTDPVQFDEWDEAFLQIVGNQIALGIDRMLAIEGEADASTRVRPRPAVKPGARTRGGKKRSFVYYRNDDCVFVDGEYLIRNVPGKILWKILRRRVEEDRIRPSSRTASCGSIRRSACRRSRTTSRAA